MTDFNVAIRIDDAEAKAAVGRVATELNRAERAAKQAEKEIAAAVAAGKIPAEQTAEAVKKLTKELIASEQAAQTVSRGWRSMFDQVQSGIGGMTAFVSHLGQIGGAATGAASSVLGAVRAISDWHAAAQFAGDEAINWRNRLRNVTHGHDELTIAMNSARDIANRTFTDIGTSVDMLSRVAAVTGQLGFSIQRTSAFTETLQKMFATSGRSAGEASSAMLQFSQALGSGVLQGDEFRSINENMPTLMQAFADKLGVTRGELKQLASEGKVTTDVMVSAIEDMATRTDIAFSQMERTFSQKMQPTLNKLRENPFAAEQAFSNPIEMWDLFSSNPQQFASVAGMGKAATDLTGATFPTLEVSEFNKAIGEQALKLRELGQAYGQEFKPEITGFQGALAATLEEIRKYPPPLSALDQALVDAKKRTQDLSAETEGLTGVIGSVQAGVTNYARQLVTTLIPGLDQWNKGQKMVSHGLSETQKLLNEINGPANRYGITLTALDTLYRRGLISATQYNDRLIQLGQTMNWIGSQAPRLPVGPGQLGSVKFDRGEDVNPAAPQPYAGLGLSVPAPNRDAFKPGVTRTLQQQAAISSSLMPLWNAELKKNAENWALIGKVGGATMTHLEDAIVRLVQTGQLGFEQMVNAMIASLTRLAANGIFTSISAYAGGGGGGFGSFYGTGASQAFPGQYGNAPGYTPGPVTSPSQVPRMGRVPFFNMMPAIVVQAPAQSTATPVVVQNNNQVSIVEDKHTLLAAMDSKQGQRLIARRTRRGR